jgi:FixJ family two-component response regulator
MNKSGRVIYLVNDDFRVREAISEVHDSEVLSFGTARGYLDHIRKDTTACLILDLILPDMNGLDLQRQLADETSPPIIFISSHIDIPSCVRAMKAGAIEFLTQPVSKSALLAAVENGFALDSKQRHKRLELERVRKGYASLTPRERQVLTLVAEGLLNKQAAAVLGISEVTLQVHRGQVMRKMKAASFAELVRMAGKLGISASGNSRSREDTSVASQGSPYLASLGIADAGSEVLKIA